MNKKYRSIVHYTIKEQDLKTTTFKLGTATNI